MSEDNKEVEEKKKGVEDDDDDEEDEERIEAIECIQEKIGSVRLLLEDLDLMLDLQKICREGYGNNNPSYSIDQCLTNIRDTVSIIIDECEDFDIYLYDRFIRYK